MRASALGHGGGTPDLQQMTWDALDARGGVESMTDSAARGSPGTPVPAHAPGAFKPILT